MNIDRLKDLLAQAGTPLSHCQVSGDKPGIQAGDQPVCRVRETPDGAAYAALIVEGINALPNLLAALESAPAPATAPVEALPADNPMRQQVEAKIAQTLTMLPGFKPAITATWAKLIFAAVEPWLAGGRESLSSASSEPTPTLSSTPPDQAQSRLDAVADFCAYMLAQEGAGDRPNEYALERWANDWNKTRNKNTGAPQ
ncbi:hypothetical protein N5C54_14930 [Pseudomonas chengduensis]|uniref:hypothetical protein n=1 Tax=Pseudomonas sp. o96-267 TaxID=2479853 RepID=UPI000F7B2D37|nr:MULTISPECIES: hypothetical protein [Pseudomonas]MDH0959075.1 hypothetical protein [Pseudomonas chengduensis]MDV5863617.1 hypothetical protein [Pseudomonas mendocina]